MNSIDQVMPGPDDSDVAEDADVDSIVNGWLGDFERALSTGDPQRVASLIEEDGNWRDLLAFTWHLTPRVGAHEIAETLAARQAAVGAHGFSVSADRTRPRLVNRLGRECIEAIFQFETKVGRGDGVLRLVADATGQYKAWVISTCRGKRRGYGAALG